MLGSGCRGSTMFEYARALTRPEARRSLGLTLAIGAGACVLLVGLSLLLTGSFVFEGAPARGEPEHVSPYFGAVVGALLATALIAAWQAFELIRALDGGEH